MTEAEAAYFKYELLKKYEFEANPFIVVPDFLTTACFSLGKFAMQ
jgi:hypothetical protein